MFLALRSFIPSMIASNREVVCFTVDDFFGRLTVLVFFLFSRLAIKFASLCSRSFSVNGFFGVIFLPVGKVFFEEDSFNLVDFLATFGFALPMRTLLFFTVLFFTGILGIFKLFVA